jgi:hypothetical protein
MDMPTHSVTLANGKKVPWDEFSTWSIFKQTGSLFPAVKNGTIKGKRKVSREWNLERSLSTSLALKTSFSKIRKITRNFGSTNGSSKAVVTPMGEFPSRVSAAKHYGVRSRKMYDWIQSENYPDFYYREHSNALPQTLGSKSVITPDGNFSSLEAAARHYKVTTRTIKNWIKNKPESCIRYATDSPNNNLNPSAKPLMTSAGQFSSLKMASDHFGVQEATIKKWITKSRPNFYFL